MKAHYSLIILCLGGLLLTSCSPGKKYELVTPPKDLHESLEKSVHEESHMVDEEYPIRVVADDHLEPGTMKIIQMGHRGQSEVRFRITVQDGKEIFREALSERVIRRAQPAIIHFGPLDHEKYPNGTARTIGYSRPEEEVDLDEALAKAGLFEPGEETATNRPTPPPPAYRPPQPSHGQGGSSTPASSESPSHSEAASSEEASSDTSSSHHSESSSSAGSSSHGQKEPEQPSEDPPQESSHEVSKPKEEAVPEEESHSTPYMKME